MIQSIIIENDNNISNLIKHYSDKGLKIKQIETGYVYDIAIDVIPCRYTYEETSELISFTDDTTVEDYEAPLAEFGVKEESE